MLPAAPRPRIVGGEPRCRRPAAQRYASQSTSAGRGLTHGSADRHGHHQSVAAADRRDTAEAGAATPAARSPEEHPRLLARGHELRRLHDCRRRRDQPRHRGAAAGHRAGDAEDAAAPPGPVGRSRRRLRPVVPQRLERQARRRALRRRLRGFGRRRAHREADRRLLLRHGRRGDRRRRARPAGADGDVAVAAGAGGRGDDRDRHLRHLGRRSRRRGQSDRRHERDGLSRRRLSQRPRVCR